MSESSRTPLASSAALRFGMGLRGMQERTELLGGELRIQPGSSFTVVTVLPIRDIPRPE